MTIESLLLRGRLFHLRRKVGRASAKPTTQSLQSCIDGIKVLRDEVSQLPRQDGGPLLDALLALTIALVDPVLELSEIPSPE